LLLALLSVVGLARLRFDVDVLNLLPAELPVVHGLKLYQAHFANARELILTLEARDADTAENAARALAETLRPQRHLVSRVLWQPPWLDYPSQAAELTAHLWLNQPPEIFAQLVQRLDPAAVRKQLAAARERLATSLSPTELGRLTFDPLGLADLPQTTPSNLPYLEQGQGLFTSSDGAFRLLVLEPATDLPHYRACADWLDAVRAQVRAWEQARDPGAPVALGYTGGPVFVAEIATGMERDLRSSALATLAIIAFLFWLAHRRWLPLLWLVTLLVVAVLGTLAAGGLCFGALNVVSLGFAAILLGLGVDYALVLYQEYVADPERSAANVRRAVGPGIAWSAFTTAGAFLLLQFGGLPGLAQLGTLVAVGVALAAAVMLGAFLPLLRRTRSQAAPTRTPPPQPGQVNPAATPHRLAWAVTALLLCGSAATLGWRRPTVDHSPAPLRPIDSPAYATLANLAARLDRPQEPLWLLIAGHDEATVGRRLDEAEDALRQARAAGAIGQSALPTALWPRPTRQRENRQAARALTRLGREWPAVAQETGFTPEALRFAETVVSHWIKLPPDQLWPTNEVSRWTLEKVHARSPSALLALGWVQPPAAPQAQQHPWHNLEQQFPALGGGAVWLTGWPLLGEALLSHVETRLRWLAIGLLAVLLGSLWLAFRRLREVALSLATLALSLLSLLAVMALANWSWNLLNLMALPVLLGVGVDYTLHVQMALRRLGGDTTAMRRTTGRALLLCAATTITGFGSLAWSSNAGLASLGRVCATGIACVLVVAVGLLPSWWRRGLRTELRLAPPTVEGTGPPRPTATNTLPTTRRGAPSRPSSFYRVEVWRLGRFLVWLLPRWAGDALARCLGRLYYRVHTCRREAVIENLLPLAHHDRAAAADQARALFQHFAVKLADLWRFERGLPVDRWFTEWSGWEILEEARARRNGVLLITPHLGNWEFGAPFLVQRGLKLLVITQAEPGNGFTELRQASRARWGVETVVIGADAFAFVEIIKRLQEGAVVALLIDRPPPPTAVQVELFGRPFQASIAAAELARASGCALLPVCVTRRLNGYAAHVLPEVQYDRRALGSREARRQLTQELLRAFEPTIRQHADQWYHFVPIWPEPVAQARPAPHHTPDRPSDPRPSER